jgi:hypothetical protein
LRRTRLRGDNEPAFRIARWIGKKLPTRGCRLQAGTTKRVFPAPRENRNEVGNRRACPFKKNLSDCNFLPLTDNLPAWSSQ